MTNAPFLNACSIIKHIKDKLGAYIFISGNIYIFHYIPLDAPLIMEKREYDACLLYVKGGIFIFLNQWG